MPDEMPDEMLDEMHQVRPDVTPGAAGDVPPLPGADDPERGDVPGWVLVTLMTAGLVVALWAIAGPLLEDTFTRAITSVTGP